jgi:hypothetical protein
MMTKLMKVLNCLFKKPLYIQNLLEILSSSYDCRYFLVCSFWNSEFLSVSFLLVKKDKHTKNYQQTNVSPFYFHLMLSFRMFRSLYIFYFSKFVFAITFVFYCYLFLLLVKKDNSTFKYRTHFLDIKLSLLLDSTMG